MDETLNRSIRQEEEIPEGTKVMVASLSFYGAPPKDGTPQERLVSRYVAQMPEEGGQTLKIHFEGELDHIEGQLKDEVEKVFLCDGARGLWKYADTTPRFISINRFDMPMMNSLTMPMQQRQKPST